MVTKSVHNISDFNYIYDNTRSGAKYCYYDSLKDAMKWGNNGELFEVARKFSLGLDSHKDPSGSFEIGSDIEEYGISCKSWKFTLQTIYKAPNLAEAIKVYFEKTASDTIEFGWVEENELVVYTMDHEIFRAFLYTFGRFERGVVRGPGFSNKKRTEVEEWFARLMG